jgi:hypothetical protein
MPDLPAGITRQGGSPGWLPPCRSGAGPRRGLFAGPGLTLTRSGAAALGAYSSIPDIEKTELVRMSAGSMRMRSSLLRLSSGSDASR